MPSLGSSAYTQLYAITTLVRSLLNDAPGNVFSDTFLLPYAQIAYRKINKALGNIRSTTYINETLLVVAAYTGDDPGVQQSITDSTAPPNQLPTDLVVPLKLWERPNGSTQDFMEMTDMTGEAGLPSVPQGQYLVFWEWRGDGLYFVGAQQTEQIRVRYQAVPPDITSAAAQVFLRDGQNTLAFLTAGLAGLARGSPLAATMQQMGEDALSAMMDAVVHQMQNQVRRRRAYSSRNRTYPLL